MNPPVNDFLSNISYLYDKIMISHFFPYVNTYTVFSLVVMHKTVKFTDKSLIYLCICYNIVLNNIYNAKRFLLNKVARILG